MHYHAKRIYTSQANNVHQQNIALDTVDQAKNSGVSIHGTTIEDTSFLVSERKDTSFSDPQHPTPLCNCPFSLSQRGNARTQKLTTMKK